MARVVIKKLNPKSLEAEVREFIIPLSERQMFHMSEETVKEIRNKIAESIQRPGSTGNLASSFFSEKTPEGYGIGNIDYLNTNAKQWYWLEHGIAQSGRKVPPLTKGYFKPGKSEPDYQHIGEGRFYTDSKDYWLVPSKPIDAHNYISKTIARIAEIANSVLSTVK